MSSHQHERRHIRAGGEVGAVRREEDLHLPAILFLRCWRRGAGSKELYEQRLMLGVQMGFRLFNQEKRHLLRMRL